MTENWNNITLSIINCKEADNTNIMSYLKSSKKIETLEFTGKLFDENLLKVIEESAIKKMSIYFDN